MPEVVQQARAAEDVPGSSAVPKKLNAKKCAPPTWTSTHNSITLTIEVPGCPVDVEDIEARCVAEDAGLAIKGKDAKADWLKEPSESLLESVHCHEGKGFPGFQPGEKRQLTFNELEPASKYVVRLRAKAKGEGGGWGQMSNAEVVTTQEWPTVSTENSATTVQTNSATGAKAAKKKSARECATPCARPPSAHVCLILRSTRHDPVKSCFRLSILMSSVSSP